MDLNWHVFFEPAPSGGGATYLDWTLAGLKTTVWLSMAAWVIALLWGSVMGVFRTLPNKVLYGISTIYVEVFRNVPLLVQLFVWYFVLIEVAPAAIGDWIKARDPVSQMFISATLCLGFFTGARICEQVRAGIESLAKGQKAAALALGFNLRQAYNFVLLPVAFRIILAPMASEMVNLVKNSAVASTIGLLELAAMGRQLVDYTARGYESFTAVTLLYIAVNLIVLGLMRWIEIKARVPGFIGGGGR